jgi:hypothetical protein
VIGSWIIRPGVGLAALYLRALGAIVDQARAAAGDPSAGVCPVCGRPVRRADPYVRFGGIAFHAQPCAEAEPPAEMAARRRAAGLS